LNAYYEEKKCDSVFLKYFNQHRDSTLEVLHQFVRLFNSMIKMYLTFIEKKSFKKFETQNIRKQFKTSQNILKMLKYIENVDKTFSQHFMCLLNQHVIKSNPRFYKCLPTCNRKI